MSSKLVQALREAIETDISDASEREVCNLPPLEVHFLGHDIALPQRSVLD